MNNSNQITRISIKSETEAVKAFQIAIANHVAIHVVTYPHLNTSRTFECVLDVPESSLGLFKYVKYVDWPAVEHLCLVSESRLAVSDDIYLVLAKADGDSEDTPVLVQGSDVKRISSIAHGIIETRLDKDDTPGREVYINSLRPLNSISVIRESN